MYLYILEVYKDRLLKIIVNLFYWKNRFLFVLVDIYSLFFNKKIYDDEKYGIYEAFKKKLKTNQI